MLMQTIISQDYIVDTHGVAFIVDPESRLLLSFIEPKYRKGILQLLENTRRKIDLPGYTSFYIDFIYN